MKRVRFVTLGCKVNQYESEAFRTGFEEAGFEVVRGKTAADIVVINTCAVTGTAGAQSRQALRQAARQNPNATIVISGCYAELAAEELAGETILKGRHFHIIGNSLKEFLVQRVLHPPEQPHIELGDIGKTRTISHLPILHFGNRTRAYLRIQDGCENFCSYCIVPFTRGPSRSLPLVEVLEQAKILADAGHREIVLTGIHLGNYGKDLPNHPTLLGLLDKLTLATTSTVYRISSLEPNEIDTNLLQLMQERKNIQPHLHIPLQSGDDAILRRMHRHYTTTRFREVLTKVREHLPDAAIGIDILAGFPGETGEHFISTQGFLTSLDFTYLHVFPYSIRPGTEAATFKNHVPRDIKEQRAGILRALSDEKKAAFWTRQLGRNQTVLVEGKAEKDGMLRGFTGNYIPVFFPGPKRLVHEMVTVKLLKIEGDAVFGEISST